MKKSVLIALCLLVAAAICLVVYFATPNIYLQDYDELWDILYENYAPMDILIRKGVDVEQVREIFRGKIKRDMTDKEFIDVVERMFQGLQNFCHLQVIKDTLTYEYYVKIYKDAVQFDSFDEYEGPRKEFFEVFMNTLLNEKSKELYDALGSSTTSGSSGGGNMSFAPNIVRYYPDAGIGYIKIPSFAARDEEHARSVYDFLETTKNYEHIIIDITDNGGGNTMYWSNFIVAPLGGSYEDSTYTLIKNGELTLRYYSDIIEELKTDDYGDVIDHVEDNEIVLKSTSKYTFETDIEHAAKRWVVVNEKVYSASEAFSAFCKNTGWATLVGRNTGGDGIGFGDPPLYALSNTGVLFRFTMCYAFNQDGTINQEVGTSPDIYCEQGETPLAACLRQLELEGADVSAIRAELTDK